MKRAIIQLAWGTGMAAGAAAAAIAVVLLLLGILGYPPLAVLNQWSIGAAGGLPDVWRSLREASPLLMTGLAAGLAFRCGVLNIGGEGQFLVGSLATITATTLLPPATPGSVAMLIACLAGALAGAAWATIAAVLERYRNVPLVLSTILLNVIALYLAKMLVTGPLQDPHYTGEQSVPVPASFRLPVLEATSGIHVGLIGAAIVAGIAWIIQARTRFGFEILVTGQNPEAAELAGIPVRRRAMEVMALSGFLAGLGGAIQLLGVSHFVTGSTPGYGFAGIAVALLGRLHPAGIAAAAVFIGMLECGARFAETHPRYPLSHFAADAVKGLVLIVMVSAGAWTAAWRRSRVVEIRATETHVAPPDAEAPRA